MALAKKICISKETSTGLKEIIAHDKTPEQAKVILAEIKERHAHENMLCEISGDGHTLTCSDPSSSSFKVKYSATQATPGTSRAPSKIDNLRFLAHCLNRDCFALSMLKYRRFKGYLSTGQHSGTHWIKWMLSHALAHEYNVEPPKFFDNGSEASNVLIGHPKHAQTYHHVPRIVSTHSIPPYPLQWKWLRHSMEFPPYVVVVRDIRKVLISNFEKWKERYGVSFSEYVAGDPTSNKYICDVWWYIRYMNRWGAVASKFPAETLVIRYEDFQANRIESLKKVLGHFGITLSDAALAAGAAAGEKDFMAAHQDPGIPDRALRKDGSGETKFSDADSECLAEILDTHLKHDFGYEYFSSPRGFQINKDVKPLKSAI